MIYSKGTVIPQFVDSNPGCKFDIVDETAVLYIRLTTDQITNYSINGPCSFAFVEISDCIFVCFNCGSLGWASCPYTPHLSDGYKTGVQYSDGMGMPLTILLVSCEDGVIQQINVVGLGNEFSNKLCAAADELSAMEFDRDDYRATINFVYNRFGTDDELAEYCKYRCTIN